MEGVEYETYHNPYPVADNSVAAELSELALSCDPALANTNYRYPTPILQHVLQHLQSEVEYHPEVAEWWHQTQSWIPESVMSWWMRQFDENDALGPMPLEWWQTQAFCVVTAQYRGDPVGAVALTPVFWNERSLTYSAGRLKGVVFNEIRGLVVAPAFRGSGAKIGSHLVRQVVYEAGNYKEALATIAITTNPAAMRINEAAGAVTDPQAIRALGISPFVLKHLACWRCEVACACCPQLENRLWVWKPGYQCKDIKPN